MNNIKLLPCPFCGGEVEYHPLSHHMNNFWNKNTIYCPSCDFMMEGNSTIHLVKRWNTRKPMERIVERFENKKKCADIKGGYQGDAEYSAFIDAIQIVKEEGSINE